MSVVEVEVAAPSVEADEVAATLERAADLLVTEGWCQGKDHRGNRRCARGAIRAASGDDIPVFYDAMGRLASHLEIDSIITWNDSAYTTETEVIRALKEAAACHATKHPEGF